MQQLIELIPIALFFLVFSMKGEVVSFAGWSHEIDGIYSATAVLMVATTFQVLLSWAMTRKLEKRLLLLWVVVLATGALTLALHNKLFIQWKPTIFNWVLALVFIGFPMITGKTFLEKTLGSQIKLPDPAWRRLNLLWIGNFSIVGGLNLVVAYNFSEDAWVAYKLYSAIGFTLLLSLLTALMVAPYIKDEPSEETTS